MHGVFDPDTVVIATFPAPPRRLLGIGADSPDSWVTFVYGAGVQRDGAAHLWTDDDDVPLPFERHGTRWGAEWTRLHSLRPSQDLTEGTWMTATFPAGSELIDGRATTQVRTHTFQSPCTAPDDARCDLIGPFDDPVTTGRVDTAEPEQPDEDEETVTEPAPPTGGGCSGGSLPLGAPWLGLCGWAWVTVRRREAQATRRQTSPQRT
jgi:hypothetical protein